MVAVLVTPVLYRAERLPKKPRNSPADGVPGRPSQPAAANSSRSPRGDQSLLPRTNADRSRTPPRHSEGVGAAADQRNPPEELARYVVRGGRPRDFTTSRPSAAQGGPDPVRLRVNGAALHPSHSFGFHRGIYWCWRCQRVASSKPRRLGVPCLAGSRPTSVSPAVSQLRNRVLPSSIAMYGWPLPVGSIPHQDLLVQQA